MGIRVFIYEYTCAAADEHPQAVSALCMEGQAMLAAVMEDFARVPRVEPCTLLSSSRAGLVPAHLPRRYHADDEQRVFRELARWAHFSLIIGPECEGILETRCSWVLEAGGRLLGASPGGVRLCGDKAALGKLLQERGIPTPALFSTDAASISSFPLVAKPRHGAGSTATFLVKSASELPGILAQARAESPGDEILVQDFAPGQPVSVAFLIGPKVRVGLVPAEQHLSSDGRFHYRGGRLPLSAGLAARAQRLADRALAIIPGLSGYVGVDLVLGEDPAGTLDRVIEVNPRLTTSYVGLRALANFNLAEAMLRVVQGEPPGTLSWKEGPVAFQADGVLE